MSEGQVFYAVVVVSGLLVWSLPVLVAVLWLLLMAGLWRRYATC